MTDTQTRINQEDTQSRISWSEIDSELSAYIQVVRAEVIEVAAKEAERCDTHSLICMADPTAIRRDIASRIRELATPPISSTKPSADRGDGA